MIRIYFFALILMVSTNCTKTNNQKTNDTEVIQKTNSVWKVNANKVYAPDKEIVISLQNISNKELLIEYPDVIKIEQKIGENWQAIRLRSYPCMAQPPLRRYQTIKTQKTKIYTWEQKEKWCEGNTDKTKVVSKGKYRLKVFYAFEEEGASQELLVPFEIK